MKEEGCEREREILHDKDIGKYVYKHMGAEEFLL
jgi:hypothetical protein